MMEIKKIKATLKDIKSLFCLKFFILSFLFCFILFAIFSIDVYAFDFGCGGLFFGVSSDWSFITFLHSNTQPLNYYGAYGYGVLGRYIIGGFGLAVLNDSIYYGDGGFAGGFGGLISGVKIIRTYVFDLDLLWWLGLGGVGFYDEGYFAFYNEFTLELGIRFTRWMELFFYVGYQFIGNLIPGPALDFSNNTITIGTKVAFGW